MKKLGGVIIKSFKNLKNIKNRDEYIKLSQLNYANTFLEIIGRYERIVQILPTEIINLNLENKFTDIRGLTDEGDILIIEGHTSQLKRPHLERYYGYYKDTVCDFSKEVKLIVICLDGGSNIKRIMAEENVCFKPHVVETKKIDGTKYLNRLRKKFRDNIELDHKDCALLVHLPLFSLDISEKEYIHEICDYLKECECIPEEEKNAIIPAMYLNIEHYIDDEYDQEKLLEAVNLLKYCENGLDRKIRLAREDEARKVKESLTKKVTDEVTKEITEEVTRKVTDEVTNKVTDEVTKEVTEDFACKLLIEGEDMEYVHKMTDLPISRISELNDSMNHS